MPYASERKINAEKIPSPRRRGTELAGMYFVAVVITASSRRRDESLSARSLSEAHTALIKLRPFKSLASRSARQRDKPLRGRVQKARGENKTL